MPIRTMKSAFDGHSIGGIAGILATITVSQYSAIMGAIAATLTAGYMGLRVYREFLKARRDTKEMENEE